MTSSQIKKDFFVLHPKYKADLKIEYKRPQVAAAFQLHLDELVKSGKVSFTVAVNIRL